MGLNLALGLIGWAKQAALGTAAAAPQFGHGVSSGPIIVTDIEQAPRDVTTGTRMARVAERTAAANGADFTCPAYPKAIGALLHAAFGDVATTGAEAPYSHVFTTGDELPYLTFFRLFNGVVSSVKDVKVDELKIEWKGSKPLVVSVNGPGTALGFPTYAPWAPTADETNDELVFTPVGGSFLIDPLGSTPASAAIIGGSLKVRNAAETIPYSEKLEGGDVSEGNQEHEGTFTVVPADMSAWRSNVTGDASGTSIATDVLYGSFDVSFKCGEYTLRAEAERVPFMFVHPDIDPKGGRVEVELVGMPLEDDNGVAVKWTLTNAQAAY